MTTVKEVRISKKIKEQLHSIGLVIDEVYDEQLKVELEPFTFGYGKSYDTDEINKIIERFKGRMKKYYKVRTIYLKGLKKGPEFEIINNTIKIN